MSLDTPLDEAEEAELAAFLAKRPAALDLEAVDGFFCALVIGAESISPSSWMPQVLGEGELEWSVEHPMERTLGLLLRKWNSVARGFAVDWETLGEERMREQMYLPAVDLSIDPPERPLASRWARGVGIGLQFLGRGSWASIDADAASAATVSLIAGLAIGENDAGRRFSHADRKSMIANIVIGLQHIYRDLRAGNSSPRPLRVPQKPGRNDACPCGSGRKFKKCCGSPARLH